MKKYIKASTEKPNLSNVQVVWSELEDGSGLLYSVYSKDHELLFEEVFDYQDVDPDTAYDSAPEMAIAVLSQQYGLSDQVLEELQGE